MPPDATFLVKALFCKVERKKDPKNTEAQGRLLKERATKTRSERQSQAPELPLEEDRMEDEEGEQADADEVYDPDAPVEQQEEQDYGGDQEEDKAGGAGGSAIMTEEEAGLEEGDEEKKVDRHKNHITTRYMTKYEKARILGTRALQISMGAPILVELNKETDPLDIAMKELKAKKIPIVVRRFLPDGSYEDWRAADLITDV
eukprot:g46525.t1